MRDCQLSVVSGQRHWERGVDRLLVVDWLSGTEKLSHDDTSPSIYLIVPR
jgi:hypothetical protein